MKVYRNSKGQLHRTDGQAIEWADGTKKWYIDDKLHREDGPAIEHASGTKKWYIDGKELTEDEFRKHILKIDMIDSLDEIGLGGLI